MRDQQLLLLQPHNPAMEAYAMDACVFEEELGQEVDSCQVTPNSI